MDKKQRKTNIGKSHGLLVSVLINLLIVGYIAFHEFSKAAGSAPSVSSVRLDIRYLLPAAACFAVALLMETLKYGSMMIASDGRYDPKGAFECAVLGKYYDNITPLGAGGQPFQIFYLKKRGLTTGSAAALPIVGFLGLQLAFSLIAVIVFIANGSVAGHISAVRISAYVGLAFYLFVPVCIILFARFPKSFGRLVCGAARLLCRLRLVRDYDKAVSDIYSTLSDYTGSLKAISVHPHLLAKVIFFSVVYQLAILSIPFFVLRAFGGTGDWWTVFSLVVFIYAAITIIPTPGNAGAAEGSFYAVFSSLTSSYLFWAMIIWRLLCYYSWLLLGLGIFTFSTVSERKLPPPKRPIPGRPLRVAQFVDIYYPHIDGVVRTVEAYSRRLNSNGDYCCVVVPRAPCPCDDNRGYDIIRTPAISIERLGCLLPLPGLSSKLRRFIAEGDFDVFHVHSPFFEGAFAVKMARKLGIPVIATFHSKFYDDVYTVTHSRFLARLITNHVVKFFSKVDEVWACSASTAETLKSYGFHGEIKVMENGVDIEAPAAPEALRRRAIDQFSLPEDKHILLFVGQQIWQKNIRLILDTVKLLKERSDDYLMVFVGEGYNADAIKRYAASLELGDSVLFTGQISDKELLNGVFLASGLFFFPSAYDNAPLVLREAALAKLPALLLRGSNSAECITDGENGFTEQGDAALMADKIQRIFSEYDLMQVGERARDTIPISWDEIVALARERYSLAEKHRYSYAASAVRRSSGIDAAPPELNIAPGDI